MAKRNPSILMKPNIKFVDLRIKGSNFDPFLIMEGLTSSEKSFFLLEGFEEWDGSSPYSYIGYDPVETLIIRDGRVESHRRGEVEMYDGAPLEVLTSRFNQFRSKPPGKGDLPFQGGCIGYVGYECAKYFDKALMPFLQNDKDPAPEACFMIFQNLIAVARNGDHIRLSGSVFLDNENETEGKLRAKKELEELAEKIKKIPHKKLLQLDRQKVLSIDLDTLPVESELGAPQYESQVSKIKEHIRAGDIFQCVLSDQFHCREKISPLKTYEVLRHINPSPFMFYLKTQNQVMLGASPERLVKVSKNIIETNPIAGTRPRGKTNVLDKKLEKALRASPKEKAEHLMLVDLGRNDVGRVAQPGSVKVSEFMVVKRFSDVMHLVSKVKGRLGKNNTPWQALASCFPAGTLSGAPKIKAMEIISKLEPVPRKLYGGAIVKYGFDGSLDSCIAIRSARFGEGRITFQAGAGIVADSHPTREYEEVLAKTRAVKRALVIARGRP